MPPPTTWAVSGSYFEACNCEAICPCRRRSGRSAGRSTYGNCDFALSWRVLEGHADSVDLAGADVVMAGSYDDDEPGSPWTVSLCVDDRRTAAERELLADIFRGSHSSTPADTRPSRRASGYACVASTT